MLRYEASNIRGAGSQNNLENADRSFVPQDDKRGGVQTVPFCIVLGTKTGKKGYFECVF
jgi:hypothetical protein